MLVLALLGSGACGPTVAGELYIDTGSRTIEYELPHCADGDHFGFFGVQLSDDEGRILEYFRNGDEPGLAFFAPGSAAFELGPADCTSLAGRLTREHNHTTGGGEVGGNVELDCDAPNGWRLWGSLSFEGCAGPPEDECDDDCDDCDDDVPSNGP